MLVIKYIPNIFLAKNWKQLFLTNFFLFTKLRREKNWAHEIPTKKCFRPLKYQREKITDPRKYDGTMTRDPRDPRWQETHRM